MVPYFHHWKDDIALVGVAVVSNLPVLTHPAQMGIV